MTEAEFLQHLPAWTDGSLDDARVEQMEAYVNAHPEAADLAQAQQAFDGRVRAALLAGVDAEATVNRLLDEARPTVSVPIAGPLAEATIGTSADAGSSVPASPRQPGRILLLVRAFAATAAALFIAFSMGWFYCIGPFECPLIEALEKASDAAAVVAESGGEMPAMGHPGAALPQGEPDLVSVGFGATGPAWRARYDVGGKDLTVLWTETGELRPSMRRRVVIEGREWWIAEEDGRRIVLFEDPVTGLLCCLVCETTEKDLLAIADGLRRRSP